MTTRPMVIRPDFLNDRHREAWSAGRALAERLMGEYAAKYHPAVLPAPARVVDELLTEFLGCRLDYAPLPLDVFAQTEWTDTATIVTVNSKTSSIRGVKDAKGVQNVAKWHECVHV